MRKILLLAACSACIASADTMIFQTPPGSTISGSGSVAARAYFTTGAGTLTISLVDLLANPTDDGQTISDLEFQVVGGLSGTTTMTSDIGQTITIGGGTGTTGTTGTANWGFGAYNSGFITCIICPTSPLSQPPNPTAPPSDLIVGPGPYSNANASFTSHDPYINQTLTITISNMNITTTTQISNVVFSFGTQFGSTVGGIVLTPEPSGALLLSLMIVPFAVWRLRSGARKI